MRLVLIDSFALIHRAYHALPKLTTPQGEPIGAVYGFVSLFLKMLKDLKPDFVAAAFDLPEETFRKKAYREYQAHRPEMPKELQSQVEKIKDFLSAAGVPILSRPGYEADDIIGTIAERFKDRADFEIIILTGDLDTLQLVSPKIKVYTLKKGLSETMLYDEEAVRQRFGFSPSFIPDFKGLKGDPSDNIPGVRGIGEKTAAALISKFGRLEELYRALEKNGGAPVKKLVSPKQFAALKEGKEQAFFSKELAVIRKDVPIEISPESISRGIVASGKLQELFEKWGFRSLLGRLKELEESSAAGSAEKKKFITPETIILDSSRAWSELELKLKEAKSAYLAALPQGFGFESKPKALGFLPGRGPIFLWSQEFPLAENLSEFLARKGRLYVAEAKPLLHQFRNLGITLPEFSLDCKIAGWLLNPDSKKYGLEDLARVYLNVEPEMALDGGGKALTKIREAEELIKVLMLVQELSGVLEAKLREADLSNVWEEIEKPLTPILVQMERNGIFVEREVLGRTSADLRKKLASLERRIYELAGERFNLASPRQLAAVLFEKLKIPSSGIRRTPSGAFSTDSEELSKIALNHPIVELLLSWREIAKILSTYVDALPDFINAATGRVHTSFLQTGTATGRLASENPNLQNIPKRGELALYVRRAFRAEKGYRLVSFDYSQMELRIIAYLAKDEEMIRAFHEGLDIHLLTASRLWNVSPAEVTPEMRNQAKTLNFGILYGMGWKSFSKTSGLPASKARAFLEEYFRDFPKIAEYIEKAKEFARANGYARTLSGRKRFLLDLFSPDQAAVSQAERIAVNMPIQGFAADIIKIAMIRVSKMLKERGLEEKARLLLQVHDELLFEIKEEIIQEASRLIKSEMENAVDLSPVPLKVDVSFGSDWASLKSLTL